MTTSRLAPLTWARLSNTIAHRSACVQISQLLRPPLPYFIAHPGVVACPQRLSFPAAGPDPKPDRVTSINAAPGPLGLRIRARVPDCEWAARSLPPGNGRDQAAATPEQQPRRR